MDALAGTKVRPQVQVGPTSAGPPSLIPRGKFGSNIRDEVLRVAYEATGMSAAAPSELSAILHAPTEIAREDAWTTFLQAYTDQILRVVRSLGGDHDILMDRYTFVLDHLREDECRRL